MSKLNRIANCNNRFQTNRKRVLCVCSAGMLRSPTAARVLAENYDYNTRAVGCTQEFALIPIDEVLIEWADEIVFMENRHFWRVKNEFDLDGKKTVILEIPDDYEYMQKELVSVIIHNYKANLQEEIAE